MRNPSAAFDGRRGMLSTLGHRVLRLTLHLLSRFGCLHLGEYRNAQLGSTNNNNRPLKFVTPPAGGATAYFSSSPMDAIALSRPTTITPSLSPSPAVIAVDSPVLSARRLIIMAATSPVAAPTSRSEE